MPKVTIDGSEIELTESQFLDVIGKVVVALYTSTTSLYYSQINGLPKTLQADLTPAINNDLQFLSGLRSQILDKTLLTFVEEIVNNITYLVLNSNRIIEYLTTINTATEEEFNAATQNSNFELPIWTRDSVYKEFLRLSSNIMLRLLGDVEQALKRLALIRIRIGAEMMQSWELRVISEIPQLRDLIQQGRERRFANTL
jgi:hypothetical protein